MNESYFCMKLCIFCINNQYCFYIELPAYYFFAYLNNDHCA